MAVICQAPSTAAIEKTRSAISPYSRAERPEFSLIRANAACAA